MHQRTDRRGPSWMVIGALALAACQPAAKTAESGVANDSTNVAVAEIGAANGQGVATDDAAPNSRRMLGTFATEEEAKAAAKSAGIAQGTVAAATIAGRDVVIAFDGRDYLIAWTADRVGSGQPQRPPQKVD